MTTGPSSERRAEWITAVAAVVQTVAVVLTVIVAGFDFLNKKLEEDKASKERVNKAYFEQTRDVFAARNLINSIAQCRVDYDPYKDWNKDDWEKDMTPESPSRMIFLMKSLSCQDIENHTDYISYSLSSFENYKSICDSYSRRNYPHH